ncbi:ribonuclease R [Thermosulfurimonas sp. F29]|uniref:ribonuclease R n=1 Tax=Thermosulfurimonas sp. F29 TaxID=2867247 RepID=UPI001C837AC7|nr:ribonuclease R [Thermosulfurimonas sp. F29]MBX6423557.1 ribonuclease R [Thermosulfurimonas sp. F29]
MAGRKTADPGKRIVEALKKAGRPLLLREIYHLLGIPKTERPAFRRLVKRLVREGVLIHIKGRRYGLPEQMQLVTGRLAVHPDGYAFVNPEDEKAPSVFIPPGRLKGALDGDLVVARIERRTRKGPEGSIIRILERRRKKIVGFFYRSRRVSTVVPEDERLPIEILIPPDQTRGAEDGDLVVAEITDFSPGRRIPEGRIVAVLGDPEDLSTQARAVIYNYDLPHRWNRRVRKALEDIPEEVRPEDKAGRRDLTRVPLVTIDGENARDFDDAICVRRTRTGYKLYVAIADVSHYVPPGSPLDQEAYLRGTSVYFPNMVVPMFPEKLSNGICSLNPRVERLAMTVEIDFDREGRVRRSRFYPAVIFSHARLTYTEVKAMLVDRDRELRRRYKPLLRMLENAAELALILRERRLSRGSIDFDLPEPEVRLDLQGAVRDIVRRERHLAHFIIEEFMIAANEAVARFLTERGYPILYRVHEPPEPLKLKEFTEFARSLGLELEVPVEPDPSWVQEVVELATGKPYAYLVNTLLLRSMKQAQYSPENIGHFGLASECYCHFTSPIRRYPDLVVHRALKAALRKKRPPYSYEELVEVGKHLSQRERTAMEAEREMFERVQVRFMRDHVGEVFTGIISGVAAFGFFVELEEYFVSGLVRLVDLHDDYYFLDEKNHRLVGRRTGKMFRLGDRVRVRVKEVNVRRRQITFELVEKLA